MKILFVVIVGISFCLNIYADDCDVWFKNIGVSSSDESDAFRHFTWSCLLTMELGEKIALKFLSAHEQNDKMQNAAERAMDTANNNVGISKCRNLGKEKTSLEEIKKMGLEELKNKNLTVIKIGSMPK